MPVIYRIYRKVLRLNSLLSLFLQIIFGNFFQVISHSHLKPPLKIALFFYLVISRVRSNLILLSTHFLSKRQHWSKKQRTTTSTTTNRIKPFPTFRFLYMSMDMYEIRVSTWRIIFSKAWSFTAWGALPHSLHQQDQQTNIKSTQTLSYTFMGLLCSHSDKIKYITLRNLRILLLRIHCLSLP